MKKSDMAFMTMHLYLCTVMILLTLYSGGMEMPFLIVSSIVMAAIFALTASHFSLRGE